jgi:uncharacterized protein YcbX
MFMSQRRHPRMAAVKAERSTRGVLLSCAGLGSIHVDTPPAETGRTSVQVWSDLVMAGAASEESAQWLSAALGTRCRLAHMIDPSKDRAIAFPHGAEGDKVSFADGFPLLGTATASLEALRGWMNASTFPMDRFRANIVIETSEPWIEDRWTLISCGEVLFEAPKPCARCVVVTIDQSSGEHTRQWNPLRALARNHAGVEGNPVFGQNLIPRSHGQVRIGEPVLMAT